MGNYFSELRELRIVKKPLARGAHPNSEQTAPPSRFINDIINGTAAFLLTSIAACIILPLIHANLKIKILDAFKYGIIIGLLVALGYYLLPIFAVLGHVIKKLRWPDTDFIAHFGPLQKFISVITIAFGLTYGFNHTYPHAADYWNLHSPASFKSLTVKINDSHIINPKNIKSIHRHKAKPKAHITNTPISSTSVFIWFWLMFSITIAGLLSKSWRKPHYPQEKQKIEVEKPQPFGLWLGCSTGVLADLYHGASIAPYQNIVLNLEDAAQNILVLGAIGAGKTTRAIHPLLVQLLDQGCGGLIFDIKGDFQKAVYKFAEQAGKEVITIGPSYRKMNLLTGLTPEVAASFLKSVFMLNANHRGDQFWIDTATELCRNTLGILSFIPKYYNLQGLYSYLFDLEERLEIEGKISNLTPSLGAKKLRLLKSYLQYHEKIFDHFDEKVKAGVNATIAQVLAPFNHPELIDSFCSENDDNAHMNEVLNGAIFLVEMPLPIWGLGGKVVYSMIKLRFFNVMQMRTSQPDWDQERPVFFMCDEFQEIVSANKDGLSDLNFWDKSRSSKTIGIISAQAISSFYAAIGDRDIAHALLQNFRQKICFRTEDSPTLNYFHSLADKVEVVKKTYSQTSSSGTNSHPNNIFSGKTSSSSQTETISYADKPVLDAQLFRRLEPEQSIALLSINGYSMDDIIRMMTIYV